MKHYDDFQVSNLKKEFEEGKAKRQNRIIHSARPTNIIPLSRRQSIPKSTMKFLVSPSPDIEVFPLEPNDALLVIGSDGLWDYLMPKRWVQLVNESFNKRQSLDDVCAALVNAAQKASSSDDITVMVISIQNRR